MGHLDEMKGLYQWVGWAIVEKGDKKLKVPMNPNIGGPASVKDRETWATASTAWKAAKVNGWTGVGFVFTNSDPYIGVDLDHCFVDGELSEPAKKIVDSLNSYTELSPSGNGLHIICKGSIPGAVNKSEKYGVEMYCSDRYFTVTGKVFLDVPIAERANELNALYTQVTADDPGKPVVHRPLSATEKRGVDKERIRSALSALPIWLEYDEWVRMLMAVHSVFPGQEGVALIEEWSPGYSGEVAKKFQSFGSERRSGGQLVTIASLFGLAKQFGWDSRIEQDGRERVVQVPEVKLVRTSVIDLLQQFSENLGRDISRVKHIFPKRGWALNPWTVSNYLLGVDDSSCLVIPSKSGDEFVNVRVESTTGDVHTETEFPFFDTEGESGELLRFGGDLIITDSWDQAIMLNLQMGSIKNTRILGICTDTLEPSVLVPILRNAGKVTTFSNGTGETPKKLARMSRRPIHDCHLALSPRYILESGPESHNLMRLIHMAEEIHPS